MTMQTIQISKQTSGRLEKESLERIARALPLASKQSMEEIPLWLLEDLALACKQLYLDKELNKVLAEIRDNL